MPFPGVWERVDYAGVLSKLGFTQSGLTEVRGRTLRLYEKSFEPDPVALRPDFIPVMADLRPVGLRQETYVDEGLVMILLDRLNAVTPAGDEALVSSTETVAYTEVKE